MSEVRTGWRIERHDAAALHVYSRLGDRRLCDVDARS